MHQLIALIDQGFEPALQLLVDFLRDRDANPMGELSGVLVIGGVGHDIVAVLFQDHFLEQMPGERPQGFPVLLLIASLHFIDHRLGGVGSLMTSEKKLEQVFEALKLEQVPAHALVGQMAGGSEFGAGWHRLADLVDEEHRRERPLTPRLPLSQSPAKQSPAKQSPSPQVSGAAQGQPDNTHGKETCLRTGADGGWVDHPKTWDAYAEFPVVGYIGEWKAK